MRRRIPPQCRRAHWSSVLPATRHMHGRDRDSRPRPERTRGSARGPTSEKKMSRHAAARVRRPASARALALLSCSPIMWTPRWRLAHSSRIHGIPGSITRSHTTQRTNPAHEPAHEPAYDHNWTRFFIRCRLRGCPNPCCPNPKTANKGQNAQQNIGGVSPLRETDEALEPPGQPNNDFMRKDPTRGRPSSKETCWARSSEENQPRTTVRAKTLLAESMCLAQTELCKMIYVSRFGTCGLSRMMNCDVVFLHLRGSDA